MCQKTYIARLRIEGMLPTQVNGEPFAVVLSSCEFLLKVNPFSRENGKWALKYHSAQRLRARMRRKRRRRRATAAAAAVRGAAVGKVSLRRELWRGESRFKRG